MIPERTIARLGLYRRLVRDLLGDGVGNVYSYQLAAKAGVTSAQVRRDLMFVGYSGSPNRGYDVAALLDSIGSLLDPAGTESVALAGVGNLGRALLAYFAGRSRKLAVVAAFDKDPATTGRVIHGCRCYPVEEARRIIAQQGIRVAILAVPADETQKSADMLVAAGIKGLLNFAPVRLRVPPDVCVENIDLMIALEKAAFFARSQTRDAERET